MAPASKNFHQLSCKIVTKTQIKQFFHLCINDFNTLKLQRWKQIRCLARARPSVVNPYQVNRSKKAGKEEL